MSNPKHNIRALATNSSIKTITNDRDRHTRRHLILLPYSLRANCKQFIILYHLRFHKQRLLMHYILLQWPVIQIISAPFVIFGIVRGFYS